MLNYEKLLFKSLSTSGISIFASYPKAIFGKIVCNKWLSYIDKYILYKKKLNDIYAKHEGIIHVCDHSNSIYLKKGDKKRSVITCHDLIAVRAAMGEFPENQIRILGKVLQYKILKGLNHAHTIVCDSRSTESDVKRLCVNPNIITKVIHLGFQEHIQKSTEKRLTTHKFNYVTKKKFILHVGNNAWYKNRDGVLKIFKSLVNVYNCRDEFDLVVVGEDMNTKQLDYIKTHQIDQNIILLKSVSRAELIYLYSNASAFLFPSHFEGFGWPPLEAQCCECPVVASNGGSLEEILRGSALIAPSDDVDQHVINLFQVITDPRISEKLVNAGMINVKRFTSVEMVKNIIRVYNTVEQGFSN